MLSKVRSLLLSCLLLLLGLCATLIPGPVLHLIFITLCFNTLQLFPIYCRINRTPIIELKLEHWWCAQIELDLAESSNIIYIWQDALSVHNGTAESIIYESILLWDFLKTSCTEIIVADPPHVCLAKIDRTTGIRSAFSGTCIPSQQKDWINPTSIIIDRMNSSQYLVTDMKTVKAVDVVTGNVTIFAQTFLPDISFEEMAQTENGDIYIIDKYTIFKADYYSRDVTLIAGKPKTKGRKDGSLTESRFYGLTSIALISPHAFLVADEGNHNIRLVDVTADKVTTFDFCSKVQNLRVCNVESVRMTSDALYVGGDYIYIIPCKLVFVVSCPIWIG